MPKLDLSTSPRAIWQLTWPQMLMMYLVFFMGLNAVWVAGQISADVQAALGMVNQCSVFLLSITVSLGSGATAAVSQSMGAQRLRRAKRYVSTTVLGTLGIGFITAALGLIFNDYAPRMLMLPESLTPVALELWDVTMYGLPAQFLYGITGIMFRATRQVIPPLWVAALVCLVNCLGCLGFGLGWFGLPNFSYMGLVWSGVGAQVLGAVLNCALLVRSGFLSHDGLPTLRWLKAGLPYLLRVALPAVGAAIVWQSGYLTLFVLVASVPVDSINALAGLTAGLRVEAMIFLPGMALNTSVAVLVGNSLGAGKPAEAKRVGLLMVAVGAIGMSVVAAFIWPFQQEIAALLSQEAGTQAQIVNYLFYNLLSTPLSIASTVMGGIMLGAGATHLNMLIFGGSFWGIRLPLGWLLGHVLWGTAEGVFVAMLVSQAVQTATMLYVVNFKNWMRYAMRKLPDAHAVHAG